MKEIIMIQSIQRAYRERSAEKAGQISETLRFRFGYSYADETALVVRAGIERNDWDELVRESEN